MAITVLVRAAGSEKVRLTFDGTQRVVIGRGSGSDVRLPDPTVSHRHATLQAQGGDFIVVDEGSTNGTFVGDVRIAPRTSRIVRSGDLVRVGRLWLELRVEPGAVVTRDVAMLTRDLALALVSQELAALGEDLSRRVRVVEGKDQGTIMPLAEEGRAYVVGRGAHCDLPLADQDVSREHVRFALVDGVVAIQDLGAKNGTWLGELRAPSDRAVPWRAHTMIKIGRTVLALEEPVGDALARIENAPDRPLAPELAPQPPELAAPSPSSPSSPSSPAAAAPTSSAEAPPVAALASTKPKPAPAPRWSLSDRLVMGAAVVLLVLSLAGLVLLLRG
jgi:pSer/pThr/pTyr-binding forkhead associated (FHA) protein